MSQREGSLSLPLALCLVVVALMKEQEASLGKGLATVGASVLASGRAAWCGGGVVTQAMGSQLGGK